MSQLESTLQEIQRLSERLIQILNQFDDTSLFSDEPPNITRPAYQAAAEASSLLSGVVSRALRKVRFAHGGMVESDPTPDEDGQV